MTPLKEEHKQGSFMNKRTASSDSGMNESSDSWTSAVVAHYDNQDACVGGKNGSSVGVASVPSDEQSAVDERKIDFNNEQGGEVEAGNDGREVKSAFRQSLMATHSRDSPRAAPVVANSNNNNNTASNDSSSKSLLRQSMSATILTHTERTFLESLLALEGELADLLCGEAHRKLSANDGAFDSSQHDTALGVFGLCDGGEMCLSTRVPGHGWQAAVSSAAHDDSQDWVQTWVRRGSSADSREVASGVQGPDIIPPDQDKLQPNQQQPNSTAPSSLIRQQSSSATRLDRLAYKKRQSSTGNDSTVRLYRAHEAGLVISQQGSARRSLARLGLEIDPRNTQGIASGGSQFGAGGAGASQEHKAFFQDGDLTPVCTGNSSRKGIDDGTADGNNKREEERAVRNMEVNERTKQKRRQHALTELDILASRSNYSPGCISPFSVGIFKNMYASKQFSFRRSNSSYSRYDSFLNERGESEPENDSAVQESKTDSTATMNTSTSSVSSVVQAQRRAAARDDIFRPSPTERRLNSLLVSAGFSTPKGMLMEAEEDMLSLDNSLGKLLLRGGPSFREETVFRGDETDEAAPAVVEIKAKKKKAVTSSLVSSLGSNFSGEEVENNQENKALNGPDSPTNSEVGDLPPLSSRSSHHKRHSTVSIMKSSSSSSLRKSQYRRSVSWGHIAVKDSENSSPSKQSESEATGISVISFPNLRRAAPIRSDSIGSAASGVVSIPPLRLGAPLRSESVSSVASILSSGAPTLSRAHPIYSPQNSFVLERLPSLHRATRLRSESTNTLGTEIDDDYSAHSFNESDNQKQRLRTFSSGAAWASPFAPKRWQPPRPPLSRQSSGTSLTGRNILIRQASKNNYEGEGMEIDELIDGSMSLGSARNFKSMLSIGGDSVVSTRSRSSFSRVPIPIQSLDDGFIVRNLDFERHSSEILRSLSNEDLYTSHNVETLGGSSSVARVYGDLMEGDSKSWDMQDEPSYAPPQNAWNVFEDEYAEEYGAYNSLSFQILGTSADDISCHPHVLSPPLMESLQNFLPSGVSENNFWLKYSLVRDGASLPSLLRQVRGAQHTLIAMETVDGEVFGCFTSSPWRKTWNYYGNGEAFLWRMRRTRSDKDAQRSILDQAKLESELDVFYWTGRNDLVQLCTHDMIAVGGGTFHSTDAERRSSLSDEERDLPPPQSEVFTKADKGGFGLAIDAELLRGTTSPCATFNSPPLSKAHANGSPFEIINLEVWTLTPCNNVADAETLEMKKLFLEPYSGAQ